MKIKENYLHEALKSDKSDKPSWKENARRQTTATEHSDAANKFRSPGSPLKDEMKFANLLESSAKPTKQTEQREESGDERGDERKSDAKREAREKDSTENATGEARAENYESAGGQAGGQQGSGFGMNSQVGGLNLNENFAARSILHIADLERLVSTVRTQTALGGKREVTLQLKRSVLEGLEIKITTGADAKVHLEFLAANEAVRAQVEKHSEELAGILRGRGVNLETLKTSSRADARSDGAPLSQDLEPSAKNQPAALQDNRFDENTFESKTADDGKIYNA